MRKLLLVTTPTVTIPAVIQGQFDDTRKVYLMLGSEARSYRWSYAAQACFYSNHFNAPLVPTGEQLGDHALHRDASDPSEREAAPQTVLSVEAAATAMNDRAGAVILAASVILSAGAALLATHSGIRGLLIAATGFAGASLVCSLFALLTYAGRSTLALSPKAGVTVLADRLAKKAALSADGIVCLWLAVPALGIGAFLH
jgi:hypothetical protein